MFEIHLNDTPDICDKCEHMVLVVTDYDDSDYDPSGWAYAIDGSGTCYEGSLYGGSYFNPLDDGWYEIDVDNLSVLATPQSNDAWKRFLAERAALLLDMRATGT